MHQGTEKTWSNKSHDTYMQIEESVCGAPTWVIDGVA